MKTWPKPKPHPRTERAARRFDESSLRESGPHGKYVHRDYLAHCLRWQHALRFVKQGMTVLDVGCGQDQMMTRVLCASQSHVPKLWVGVDHGRIAKKTKIAWTKVIDEFDFTTRWRELSRLGPFDVVSCFEVIEHMRKPDGLKLLKGIAGLAKKDGTILLSTPVYNRVHMAAAHIHEYGFEELRELIGKAGLEVVSVHGTFMTSHAMMRAASLEEKRLVERLHEWHSWDVLSNFLAPKYPRESSNCAWILRRRR